MKRLVGQRLADRERGQILVVFAGGLITLLIIVGLVIDGGWAFVQRRDAQNISDLAAMAGTKVIADHHTNGGRTGRQVYAAIAGSVARNSCSPTDATPCSWKAEYVRPNGANAELALGLVVDAGEIPVGAQGVLVKVNRQPRTYFLGVIGQSSWQIGADATALAAAIPFLPPGQVLPIAADPPARYEPGELYTFTAGMDGPGNFGWLSWDGSNDPNTLATSLCTPNNPLITFPQEIPGDPGKSNSSSVRACLDMWISGSRAGETVLIPIWAPSSGPDCATGGTGNNLNYCIVGLAAFVLTERSQPAIDEITGRFVEYYSLPSVPAGYGGAPSAGDAAYFLGLVR